MLINRILHRVVRIFVFKFYSLNSKNLLNDQPFLLFVDTDLLSVHPPPPSPVGMG